MADTFIELACGCCGNCCCIPSRAIGDTILMTMPDGPVYTGFGCLGTGPYTLTKQVIRTDPDGCIVTIWRTLVDCGPAEGFECNTITLGIEYEVRECLPPVPSTNPGTKQTACRIRIVSGANGMAFLDSDVFYGAFTEEGVTGGLNPSSYILISCGEFFDDTAPQTLSTVFETEGCALAADCTRLSLQPLHQQFNTTSGLIDLVEGTHVDRPVLTASAGLTRYFPWTLPAALCDGQFWGIALGGTGPYTWTLDNGNGQTWTGQAQGIVFGLNLVTNGTFNVLWSVTDSLGATVSGTVPVVNTAC